VNRSTDDLGTLTDLSVLFLFFFRGFLFFKAVFTRFINQTLLTKDLITNTTMVDAGGTARLTASITGLTAAVATGSAAVLTRTGTVVAQIDLTVVAVAAVLPTDTVATILAVRPVPLFQRNIGGTVVIGLQYLPDHYEKIEQPSLFQCSLDREMSIPFT
jgi:hypothetical protein